MAAETEISERQPRVVDLGARFTPEARERIEAFRRSFVSFEPRLGLLYSNVGDEPSWSLTAFGEQTVRELMNMYGSFGAVVCYDIDGVDVIVPQLAHIELLDSGTLEFQGDRICRREADVT